MKPTPCIRLLLVLLPVILTTIGLSQPVHEWERTNPGGGGAFSTVEGGPTGQIIAGSDLGGAYYSWDGGQNWEVYGVERGLNATHVCGLGFHPTDGNIFFIGTDDGIYKSNNGGGWLYQVLAGGYVTDIKVAPSQPQRVYASRQTQWNATEGAVFRSDDGGETWSQESTNLPSGLHLLKLAIHPTNPDTLLLLTGQGRFACGPANLYRSADGGTTWSQVASSLGPIMDLAIHPDDGDVVYLTTMNADCAAQFYWTDLDGSIHRSTDSGISFGAALANHTGVISIKRDLPSTIRLVDPREPFPWTNGGTWESTDSGASWNKTGDVNDWGTGFQNDLLWSYGTSYNGICKTIGQSLAEPDVMFWVNVQWAFSTYDGGQNFTHRHTRQITPGWWQSTGFDNVVMNEISINESNPDEIYIAFADIGLWRSLDHGTSWQSCNHADYTGNWDGFGGNVLTVLTDPDRAGTVWAAMQGDLHENTFVLYSDQSGQKDTWQIYGSGLPASNRITGLSLDHNSTPGNRTLFVCADGDVYRSQNNGLQWDKVREDNGLYFTAVDALNGQIVYAGGRSGLWRSTDGGNNWSEWGTPEMRGTNVVDYWADNYQGVSCIEPDPNQEGWVYISAFGSGKGLYRNTNNGAGWSKIYSNDFMRAVIVAPQNSEILYAGSSSAYYQGGYLEDSEGILYSNNAGNTWTQVNGLTPYPFATTFAIDHKTSPNIWVGSPGSGFQYAALPGVACIPTAVVNTVEVRPGWHRSEGTLASFDATISSGTQVFFESDTDISLESGFNVEPGAIFTIRIKECPPD